MARGKLNIERLYEPLSKNSLSKVTFVVKVFKPITRRKPNDVRYFDNEVDARKYARKTNGIIYREIKINH